MPYLSRYHLNEQQAGVLLGPVNDAVAELERRTRHYAERLPMSPADRAAMLAANRTLAAAYAEIERLRQVATDARTGSVRAADENGR